MKKEETTDIVQYIYDQLEKVGINKVFTKQDTSTKKTLFKRGDIWISLSEKTKSDFEKNIIALVEAKHKKCVIGDKDWKIAMEDGKKKAEKQKLNYYIVTNCKDTVRFFNRFNDEEILLDNKPIRHWQSIDILVKIQSQVNKNNSKVIHKLKNYHNGITEKDFQKSLDYIKDVYRSCAISDTNEKIKTAISFVLLKYIAEKEAEKKTLDTPVKLWDSYGRNGPNFKTDILGSNKDIMSGEYGNKYLDFENIIEFSNRLKNEHFAKIYSEFDKYHFYGCGFDVYGAVYEAFASKKDKKEFGEFYTRRHITRFVSRLLLRKEKEPRNFKICDPACGTGGFLTEAFKVLVKNYEANGKLNKEVLDKLKKDVFYGYDNKPLPISMTKVNMFLVGDGHTNIIEKDSLLGLEENMYDYVVANPPYGPYEGPADINTFEFTNLKRYELMFLEKMIKATKYGGEMAIVTPDGTLETPTNENFRIKLLQHCNISAIISLTRFAFAPYTKEKTYVLFMQRKQEDEVGEIQTNPIWHFILDYDGFANSDKRYPTPFHNDIAELNEVFLKGEKIGKYGFVNMDKVNKSNFHNLLSEFYLRPKKIEKIDIKNFTKNYDSLVGELNKLVAKSKKLKEEIVKNHRLQSIKIKYPHIRLDKVLKVLPKNAGLTEEFIYLNDDPRKKRIPVYTSSYEILAYLPKDTKKNDNPLIVNEGPALIIFRKGKAGTMFYTNAKEFIASENAIPLQIGDEWKDRVLLKWFYYIYRGIFLGMVTSKADNATFNLDFLERLYINIPDLPTQKSIIEKYEKLVSINNEILSISRKLKHLEFISMK